jgi:hypothetical protein
LSMGMEYMHMCTFNPAMKWLIIGDKGKYVPRGVLKLNRVI